MSNENVSAKSLGKVVIDNFAFMFFFSSGFGFSLSALGLMSPENGIYMFTIVFSTVWGFVGAAAAWSRSNDNIRTPKLFEAAVEKAISNESNKFVGLGSRCFRVRRSFYRRIFIPFVQSPHCRKV